MTDQGQFQELLKIARQAVEKSAVIDAATLAGAADPAAAGGDPAAMGGDPAAAMGGDPMAAAAGGGGDTSGLEQRLASLEQQLAAGGGAGGGAGAAGVEPIKPKIDQNVVALQTLKMLARISDAMGIPVSASEMVMTQDDLTQFGLQQENAGGGGVQGGAAGPESAISPIEPMQGASPAMAQEQGKVAEEMPADGEPYGAAGQFEAMSSQAAAIARIMAGYNDVDG